MKSRAPRPPRRPLAVLADDRGSYQTEYTVVLVAVAIAVGLALAALGVPLVLFHRSVLTAVTSPVP